MAERWHKERGAWVLARAGRRRGARRRGERLMSAARRHERSEAGLGDAVYGEVSTPNIIHRSIFREEGALNTAGWAWWTLTWVAWSLVLLGPAWALAWLLYRAWMHQIDRLGPPRMGPAVGAAAGVLVVGALVGLWLPPQPLWVDLLAGYLHLQAVAALGHLGWLSWAYGWPAVQKKLRARSGPVEAIQVHEITVPSAVSDTAEISVQEQQQDEQQEQYAGGDQSPVITVEIVSADQEGAAR